MLREVKELAPGHTARKSKILDSKPASLVWAQKLLVLRSWWGARIGRCCLPTGAHAAVMATGCGLSITSLVNLGGIDRFSKQMWDV